MVRDCCYVFTACTYSSILCHHRFDLLGGHNGNEGGIAMGTRLKTYLTNNGLNIKDCCSMNTLQDYLDDVCTSVVSPVCRELCSYALMSLYELTSISTNKERAVRLSEILGQYLLSVSCCSIFLLFFCK